MRRTRDPKRKDKFFSSKLLLAGDNNPATAPFRAFMARYAQYVLLRAQMFGGLFDEIASPPPSGIPSSSGSNKKKKAPPPKPVTSTNLRSENLDAARLLLKSGTACVLKDGEECENTAYAVERVVSDMLGLAAAVATALNRALKDDNLTTAGSDALLLKKWCEFYSEELLPQTRAMVKRTTPKLDAFGLFLPSRMGATLSPDLLQKGLKLGEDSVSTASPIGEAVVVEDGPAAAVTTTTETAVEPTVAETPEGSTDEGVKEDTPTAQEGDAVVDGDEVDEEAELDEYEYEEEEEYYDDEDEA
jgi:hypothetical protein